MRNLADEVVEALGSAGTKLGKSLKRKSDDQVKNIREIIEASRRLDVELGDSVRRPDAPDNLPTIDVTVRPFNTRNYDDQLREQLDGLENLTVSEWIRNRARWLENGGERTPASLAAQQAAREDAFDELYEELRSSGVKRDDAAAQAREWLKTQAATHEVDSIAGGYDDVISGVGNSGINSSIGSQWKTRVLDLDSAVAELIRNSPGLDLTQIRMNLIFS